MRIAITRIPEPGVEEIDRTYQRRLKKNEKQTESEPKELAITGYKPRMELATKGTKSTEVGGFDQEFINDRRSMFIFHFPSRMNTGQ